MKKGDGAKKEKGKKEKKKCALVCAWSCWFQRISGIEDLQTQINSLKAQIGMHPTVGSIPLYTRTDADAAFDLDRFIKRDETEGIPYRTAGYGKSNMTPDRSRASYQQGLGSRHGTPNQTGRQSQATLPHREGRQIYSPRRQTPETRLQLATGMKTPTPAQQIEAPPTAEPAYPQRPSSKPLTPTAETEDLCHAADAKPKTPVDQAPVTSEAKTPVQHEDPYHAKEMSSKPATPQAQPSARTPAGERKTPTGEKDKEGERQKTPKTVRTERTDRTGAGIFMNADDLETDEDDGWGEDEFGFDSVRDAKAEEAEAQKRAKYEKADPGTARTEGGASNVTAAGQGAGTTSAQDILADI